MSGFNFISWNKIYFFFGAGLTGGFATGLAGAGFTTGLAGAGFATGLAGVGLMFLLDKRADLAAATLAIGILKGEQET